AMQGVPEEIQRRHIAHCTKADKTYGEGIAKALKALAADKVKPRSLPARNRDPR
ncbi:MAG: hypothetical protein KGQ32_12035, partial [Xanthomonadaceae bacterium]|nr:hypothetical protein [Xanthomonadaceae bacterium]